MPETRPSCPVRATAEARRQDETAIPIPPWMTRGRGGNDEETGRDSVVTGGPFSGLVRVVTAP
ncbi:hypothetical protein GCM10009600_01890 [Oerskovia paurometabola]